MPPLLPRSKRLRTALFAGISIVLVVAVALLLANTADTGGKQTARAKAKAKAKARAAAVKPVKLVPGRVGRTSVWVAPLDFDIDAQFESALLALMRPRPTRNDHGHPIA